MENIYVTRSSMPPYEEYIEAIRPLWDSHWLTNMGIYHHQLEEALSDFLGVPYVSLMANGHMALELTIQSFGFPEGSEVITTPFTFVSTTHAIVRNGLIPVFCDIKDDGTIDENKIEPLITPKTAAILPVHVYGNICNVGKIKEIAVRHGLKVIYDAAHAFGEELDGMGVGNFGDASIFSFHATKVFHTIEGGAVSFADQEIYERLYNLKNFGIRGQERVVEVGANAKLNEFSAIMGLCNLKHVEEYIKNRREIALKYQRMLSDVKGIDLINGQGGVKRNYGYIPIRVNEEYPLSRDELFDVLSSHQIFCRKYFYPLTVDCECYRDKNYDSGGLPNARKTAERVLTLPIYEGLKDDEIDYIVSIIRAAE